MNSAQFESAPVVDTADASTEGMVAPGQENLLEEFIQEQEAAGQEEPEKLLGKFNSADDLARAYQELERKLSQQGQDSPSDSEPSSDVSPELAAEIYGADKVEALAAKGIDMADLIRRGDAGEDLSEHYDTLAETYGVTRQMVENYIAGAQQPAPAAPAATGGEWTDVEVAAMKASVGGEQQFAEISQWAMANLSKDELASYNAVVDGGNKEAAKWALKAIQARRQSPDAVVEPKMIGGTAPQPQKKFESTQQVMDAMNKRNERGQRMYDVDEAYRNKVVALLDKSDVF